MANTTITITTGKSAVVAVLRLFFLQLIVCCLTMMQTAKCDLPAYMAVFTCQIPGVPGKETCVGVAISDNLVLTSEDCVKLVAPSSSNPDHSIKHGVGYSLSIGSKITQKPLEDGEANIKVVATMDVRDSNRQLVVVTIPRSTEATPIALFQSDEDLKLRCKNMNDWNGIDQGWVMSHDQQSLVPATFIEAEENKMIVYYPFGDKISLKLGSPLVVTSRQHLDRNHTLCAVNTGNNNNAVYKVHRESTFRRLHGGRGPQTLGDIIDHYSSLPDFKI